MSFFLDTSLEVVFKIIFPHYSNWSKPPSSLKNTFMSWSSAPVLKYNWLWLLNYYKASLIILLEVLFLTISFIFSQMWCKWQRFWMRKRALEFLQLTITSGYVLSLVSVQPVTVSTNLSFQTGIRDNILTVFLYLIWLREGKLKHKENVRWLILRVTCAILHPNVVPGTLMIVYKNFRDVFLPWDTFYENKVWAW